MSELKIPESFEIPKEYTTSDFFIRPLYFADVEADYEAVMSSIEIIKKTRGGAWPDSSMTLEENHRDLGWHDKEFEDRSSFAYTAWTPDKKEYLGCFYFYPAGTRGKESAGGDVDVSFWVTQKAYDEGYYEKLYIAVSTFLEEWPFEKIIFTNKIIPEL